MTASRWFADDQQIPFGWVPYHRTNTGPAGGFYAWRPVSALIGRLMAITIRKRHGGATKNITR